MLKKVTRLHSEKRPLPVCGKHEAAHQLIGKKWVSLIVRCLMDDPKRFSEIQAYIPDLSKRVLNERIKELEEAGIVFRRVRTDRPFRTEYALTQKGWELGSALSFVDAWAEKWM